jgi:hypothetical protein
MMARQQGYGAAGQGLEATDASLPYSDTRPVVTWDPDPPNLDDSYWKAKERIVDTEQHVLRWLAFDCSVSHPHRAVVLLVDRLLGDGQAADWSPARWSQLRREIVCCAWQRVNDCVFSASALQHAVMPLAGAAVRLTVQQLILDADNVQLNEVAPEDWCIFVGVRKDALERAMNDLEKASFSISDPSAYQR